MMEMPTNRIVVYFILLHKSRIDGIDLRHLNYIFIDLLTTGIREYDSLFRLWLSIVI
jgi:hypothetical protein